ncbi:hypothetical protein KR044_000409, partial [Drosophila immigrans]
NEEEAARLRLQLEHLAQLSQQDFEREFRTWMAQEGIEGKVQAQVRMDLIHSFNSTSLAGKLLRKASASACGTAEQPQCLPMVLALQTLVAEFLYAHNLHYTLSVYCSELPQRPNQLPDFESRAAFRFSRQELQQLLSALLGEHSEQPQLGEQVLRLYADEQKISLLLGFCQALVASRQQQEGRGSNVATQTAAATEPPPAFDGVEQQLAQLMLQLGKLCTSCAPPVEIISQSAFEQLVQQELSERQRLLQAGQTLQPGQTAVKLPASKEATSPSAQDIDGDGNTVQSPAGPIQLPAESASVPKLPQLHAEQLASLAMVQQALQQLQQPQTETEQGVRQKLERMEALVSELAGCIQTLSNVLNLAMEQEYAVGRHKGFKLGYREGFSHGHFMGMQEGMQSANQQHAEHQAQQLAARQQQRREASSQTLAVSCRAVACQTPHKRQRHRATSMERRLEALSRHVASQTAAVAQETPPLSRSYEQWIYEMLHSRSGQIFLERVELSLNKALELQKKRLDELFNVKLRHHAELMRLSSRQSSWRTLCRHVERDSQSLEARDLVHKIFRLLEHYEAHHQLLAEKIQQTEKAAEQAAHIEPVWKDASDKTTACHATPASSESIPLPVHPVAATAEALPPKSVPPAATAPPTLPIPTPSQLPAADAIAPPAVLPAAPTAAPVLTNLPSFVSAQLPGLQAFPPAALPALFTHFLLPLAAPPAAPEANLSASESPGRPQMHHVATNTQRACVEERTQPSFNEALLSAKHRMLQLEQESDLLEQSFLGYLERARAQKQKTSCAPEQQQLQRTLDSFREWQLRMRNEESSAAAAVAAAPPTPTPAAVLISPIYSGSELEPDSYQFTNAIAVARHKLLSELQATAATPASAAAAAQPASSSNNNNKLLVDQVQDETQQLLSRVEATLARVSKPASLQLLPAESQLPLDALSSSSSLEQCANNGASRKLQRSMAKMQLLFGKQQQTEPQTATKRPWSAPISVQLAARPTRPHTAPSSLTDTPAAAYPAGGQLLGLLDALSDVGSSSSSSNTDKSNSSTLSSQHSRKSGVSSGTASNPLAVSPSQEFWRRMNM